MKSLFTPNTVKIHLFSCLFLTLAITLNAQSHWEKIPALTTQYYSEKDEYGKNIQALRSEVKDNLDKIKKATEEKANKMTDAEKMALATRYQKMKPDEIVKMQSEMMAITQAQAEFQQVSSEMETQFNQLESDFRSEFGKRLGPIEQEYQKLPDGEGTPQWAIKKGEELTAKYNKEYEAICDEYFSATNGKFRKWLQDFDKFLHEKEIPFNEKMIKMQYDQYGISHDGSAAGLMALDRYLEKCGAIAGLRRPYPQG
jgi:Skp family chaperone for outer membrane proteins